MESTIEIDIDIGGREYQEELIEWFRQGGKRAFACWHRRAGKDRTAAFIESHLAFQQVGLYWHCLPEFAHCRRAIWDNITRDGKRLIDLCFPDSLIKSKSEQEMKIELVNGSIWQLVGADNYDRLISSNPRHVTYSEFAVQNPMARNIIRPILAENDGSELIITTPRGYNHAWDLWNQAIKSPHWFTSLKTVDDTGCISVQALAVEKAEMPDELYRQEFFCDYSAANVGSVLGRYVEQAEREGRVGDVPHDPAYRVIVSADIGFRDTAAWWFLQSTPDGFRAIRAVDGAGLDAEEWVQKLREIADLNGYEYETIWLPHDARAKTFATRNPAVDVFRRSGLGVVRIVPRSTKSDYINAARLLLREMRFDAVNCARGLEALRDWAFAWDDERKIRSSEPEHGWSSHLSESLCYMALILKPYLRAPAKAKREINIKPMNQRYNLNQLFEDRENGNARW